MGGGGTGQSNVIAGQDADPIAADAAVADEVVAGGQQHVAVDSIAADVAAVVDVGGLDDQLFVGQQCAAIVEAAVDAQLNVLGGDQGAAGGELTTADAAQIDHRHQHAGVAAVG